MATTPSTCNEANISHLAGPFTKTRVLHVINGEHYSGAERVQDLLAACLPDEGFEVGFACVAPGKFVDVRVSQDAPLYELPMASKFDLRPAWKLAKIVREENYEIIHAHTPRSGVIARIASALTGKPLVYHVHSPASRDSTKSLNNVINHWTECLTMRHASKLITVSQSLAAYMSEQGFADESLEVVQNGVPRQERVHARATPSANWTLGTVALFRPRKGTEVLLDALAILKSEGLNVKLRAVGPFETSDYEQQLKQRVKDLQIEDLVTWTGFTTDVNAELRKMDLFVLPSLFGEGLPMVVLEAMAAGVPPVGTHVEGVPEAIRDGVDGTLAEPGNAKSLAHAIRRVVSGELDWNSLRHNSITRQAAQFSDQSMAAGVADVYRSILGKTNVATRKAA